MTDQERIIVLEKRCDDLLKSYETLAELMDVYQKKLARSVTELSEHFVHQIEPKVKKIVRDELEKA